MCLVFRPYLRVIGGTLNATFITPSMYEERQAVQVSFKYHQSSSCARVAHHFAALLDTSPTISYPSSSPGCFLCTSTEYAGSAKKYWYTASSTEITKKIRIKCNIVDVDARLPSSLDSTASLHTSSRAPKVCHFVPCRPEVTTHLSVSTPQLFQKKKKQFFFPDNVHI